MSDLNWSRWRRLASGDLLIALSAFLFVVDVTATVTANSAAASAVTDSAGLRGSVIATHGADAKRSTENPLIAEYRRRARKYEQAASEADEASAAWASKTRAAVYGGGPLTVQATQVELTRRGFAPWARAVWDVERMLRDPSSQTAELAAAQAAAPYEQRYRDYQATQASYNVSANGFKSGADRDEAMAKQLLTYATQYRLQGDDVTADEYVSQATLLRRQEDHFRGFADKYHNTVERIQTALPTIQRLAEQAAKLASWQQNPKGAIAPKDVFPYTVAPPEMPVPPAPPPAWSFPASITSSIAALSR